MTSCRVNMLCVLACACDHSDSVVLLFLILGEADFAELAMGREWVLMTGGIPSGGCGGNRRVTDLLRQKEMAGMTGP